MSKPNPEQFGARDMVVGMHVWNDDYGDGVIEAIEVTEIKPWLKPYEDKGFVPAKVTVNFSDGKQRVVASSCLQIEGIDYAPPLLQEQRIDPQLLKSYDHDGM